jgi:glycosyltransferase involved in cell wall biosynthesis
MKSPFEKDEHPNGPRILFIGLGHSSHTHSWIDLLDGAQLNVRLFCTSADLPPDDWKVRTYVTANNRQSLDPGTRACLFESGNVSRFVHRMAARARGRKWNPDWLIGDWLLEIIQGWRPHIVHTLGLDAAKFYYGLRPRIQSLNAPRWVLQTRGGSDLQLAHLDPQRNAEIAVLLRACDQLLSDNTENFRIALEMGVRDTQISKIGTVPGTGGIDVEALARHWVGSPSSRRLILAPKFSEAPWSKALPLLEAIKLCWEKIQPCEIHLLVADPEAIAWFRTVPEAVRRRCHTYPRLPREKVLEMMTQARVMLAPSLVDGTPNSMFEAMAAGALPIVSPLETIRTVVEDEENVLFARNLYPQEIADALVRAMNDDKLVDAVAERNLELVRRIANRDEVRPRVVSFYECLAGGGDEAITTS